jgi:transketolase
MPAATTQPAVDLKSLTREMRVAIVRMIEAAGSGHPGGSLSIIDILAVMYFKGLFRFDASKPDWAERDRLILSKGHGCPALYTAMAFAGYFPKEQLNTLRKLGSPLQGHPDRLRLPGIEFSTGSLGQGLSVGVGMACAAKLDQKDWKTIVILGDGELQEGQNWEAFMAAPKFGLDNLIAIVDWNNGQIDGPVDQVMPIEPLADKFESFRWDVHSIDGHDLDDIEDALKKVRAAKSGRPQVIIAKTVKGKGVSFMENNIAWHGNAPKKEDAEKAVWEIVHNGR